MPEAQIAQALQLLDLMLEHFADDGHWTRGRYDDGNGGYCLVGALLHLSRKHRLPRAPAIVLLQDAMPRPGLPLVHFNDSCCGSVAELRSIILKARRLADDHAEQSRAAAAAKTWLLAQIRKKTDRAAGGYGGHGAGRAVRARTPRRLVLKIRHLNPLQASSFLIPLALLTAPLAQAAGFRFIEAPADADGPALKGAMWSPCSAAPAQIDLGNVTLPGVKDCPIGGDKLPLVVISHGRGGSFVGHHDIAEMLADAGFVAAAINHPGDTASDMSRSDDLSVFIERPNDIKRLIDFMIGASPAASNIDPDRIGYFGFSRGGYTGLVLVGAKPDWATAAALCEQSSSRICGQIRAKEYPEQPLTHDPRIKSAVIADPLALWFTADSLQEIKVPIQLWASELGGDGVTPHNVAAVDSGLPIKHEYHVVPNSAHFAFLAPCPPALAKARPELCTDAPGFDRGTFHQQFDADVLAFFRAQLGDR